MNGHFEISLRYYYIVFLHINRDELIHNRLESKISGYTHITMAEHSAGPEVPRGCPRAGWEITTTPPRIHFIQPPPHSKLDIAMTLPAGAWQPHDIHEHAAAGPGATNGDRFMPSYWYPNYVQAQSTEYGAASRSMVDAEGGRMTSAGPLQRKVLFFLLCGMALLLCAVIVIASCFIGGVISYCACDSSVLVLPPGSLGGTSVGGAGAAAAVVSELLFEKLRISQYTSGGGTIQSNNKIVDFYNFTAEVGHHYEVGTASVTLSVRSAALFVLPDAAPGTRLYNISDAVGPAGPPGGT